MTSSMKDMQRGSRSRSASDTGLSAPTTRSSSACIPACAPGCRTRYSRHHRIMAEVVSVPATNRSRMELKTWTSPSRPLKAEPASPRRLSFSLRYLWAALIRYPG